MLTINDKYVQARKAFLASETYRFVQEYDWIESKDTMFFTFEKVKDGILYWLYADQDAEFDFSGNVTVSKHGNEDGTFLGVIFEGDFRSALTCV